MLTVLVTLVSNFFYEVYMCANKTCCLYLTSIAHAVALQYCLLCVYGVMRVSVCVCLCCNRHLYKVRSKSYCYIQPPFLIAFSFLCTHTSPPNHPLTPSNTHTLQYSSHSYSLSLSYSLLFGALAEPLNQARNKLSRHRRSCTPAITVTLLFHTQ